MMTSSSSTGAGWNSPKAAMAAMGALAEVFDMTEVAGDENLPVEDLSDDELDQVGGGNGGNGGVGSSSPGKIIGGTTGCG